MDASKAADFVRLVSRYAKFDRDRFRVTVVESVDGTKVEIHADTIPKTLHSKIFTNYDEIDPEDITGDVANQDQIRVLIEMMVSSLEEFVKQHETDSEVEPDGREDRPGDRERTGDDSPEREAAGSPDAGAGRSEPGEHETHFGG